MANRFEDLAPLIAPRGIDRSSQVGYRQGVVEAWDPLTASNEIRIGGTVFADLPVIASSTEVLLIRPGDVVAIKVISGDSAWSTMYVEGRVTLPDTPQAGSFFDLFGLETNAVDTFQDASSESYTDLATVGPTVTVEIGQTGRCLIILSAEVLVGGSRDFNAYMSVATVSGPTGVAASDARALRVGALPADVFDTNAPAISVSASRVLPLTGLAAGEYTFRAKYRRIDSGGGLGPVRFGYRSLTAWPM